MVPGGITFHLEPGTIRATEIRWTWELIQVERWGRWTRLSSQHWSISTAADHREIGGENGRGTFIEPPLPLGGGCQGDMSTLSLQGRTRQVMQTLTHALAGKHSGKRDPIHREFQGRPRNFQENKIQQRRRSGIIWRTLEQERRERKRAEHRRTG